jgi:hypothetical protein
MGIKVGLFPSLLGGRAVVMTRNGQIGGIPLKGGDLQFVLRQKRANSRQRQYCDEGTHFVSTIWKEEATAFSDGGMGCGFVSCRSSPSAFRLKSLSAPKCLGLSPIEKLAPRSSRIGPIYSKQILLLDTKIEGEPMPLFSFQQR